MSEYANTPLLALLFCSRSVTFFSLLKISMGIKLFYNSLKHYPETYISAEVKVVVDEKSPHPGWYVDDNL